MSLSSLIVQREVATIRQVEEALARQVLYGGDLVTNVLEVAQVAEGLLMPLVAETTHMPHAPIGPLPPSTPEARSLVPQELAVRRSIFPLELSSPRAEGGSVLTLAVAEPLERDVLDELSFALGVQVEQRVAPLVRIREALSAAYGAPLDRRMTRLLGRLAGVEMPGSGSLPPLLQTGPSTSFASPTSDVRVPPRKETPRAGSFRAVRQDLRRTHAGFPAPVPYPDELTEKMPPVSTIPEEEGGPPSVVIRASVILGPVPGQELPPIPPEPTPEPGPLPLPRPAPVPATPERRSSIPPSHPSSLVRLVQIARAASPSGRRRRGPITLERAKVELEQAAERDTLLDLFFDYSLQFFEYTALFIVHGDLAEGRDAYGPGATRHKVLGVGVPLDLPSALSAARDRSAPVIARPTKEGLDAVLVQDLDRSPQWPILIVPLVVRGRTVALLYGDNGETGVDGSGSSEVTAFALRVGQSFERIIVRRKLQGFAADKPTSAPRIDPKRVSAKPSKPPRVAAAPEERAARLSKALGPEGYVRAPSVAPPAEVPDAPAIPPAAAVPSPPIAPLPPMVSAMSPLTPIAPPVAPSPPSPPVSPSSPSDEDGLEEIEPDPESQPEPEADIVLPLSNRRTIRDAVAPFPELAGDGILVAAEFSDMPPPPQVAAVRPLSGPPIPREDPPALALDLTPPPAARMRAPVVEGIATEEPDEQQLLRELDALTPGNSAPDLFEEEGDFDNEPDLPTISVPPPTLAPKPPPSQAVAVPPHHPPSARRRPDSLPSVIVDVDSEFLALVDRLAHDPTDEHAEAELLRQGQYAMPGIMARFPGPITLSLAEIEDKKARVGDCGPILRLIAGQRRVALPFVLEEVDSSDGDRRFWATFLLTELAYPEAVPTIVSRLFDEEDRIRKVARLAARVVAESARETLVEELDRIVRDPHATVEERIATMDTLGELRDAAVVPVLLGSLGDDSEEVAQAARRALSLVSRQDFGRDTRRWLAWWSGSSAHHRIEWLIDALTHENAAMRKAAAQELKTLTREYFGYYEDLPKRERERAQQRYRDWWRSEGRARFRRG